MLAGGLDRWDRKSGRSRQSADIKVQVAQERHTAIKKIGVPPKLFGWVWAAPELPGHRSGPAVAGRRVADGQTTGECNRRFCASLGSVSKDFRMVFGALSKSKPCGLIAQVPPVLHSCHNVEVQQQGGPYAEKNGSNMSKDPSCLLATWPLRQKLFNPFLTSWPLQQLWSAQDKQRGDFALHNQKQSVQVTEVIRVDEDLWTRRRV
jgi:hypothetical protein